MFATSIYSYVCIILSVVLFYEIFLFRIKPGTQHIKLKQELEEKIAEQRSLEWAKRLEQEKQNHMELDAESGNDDLDDIDKIEAKLEGKELIEEESSDEEEFEEEIELEDINEKPRKRNSLIADEAEESECDDIDDIHGDENGGSEGEADEDDGDEDTEDSSEESEDDQEAKPKKGRILKAFEDSDDDDSTKVRGNTSFDNKIKENEILNEVNKETASEIKETQGTIFTVV